MIANFVPQVSRHTVFQIIVYESLILGEIYFFHYKIKYMPYEIIGNCMFKLNLSRLVWQIRKEFVKGKALYGY